MTIYMSPQSMTKKMTFEFFKSHHVTSIMSMWLHFYYVYVDAIRLCETYRTHPLAPPPTLPTVSYRSNSCLVAISLFGRPYRIVDYLLLAGLV